MADQTMETVNQQKQETMTKQTNPLRVEQRKRLVEYIGCKKQQLKNFNEQITRALSIWVVLHEVASHCVLRDWDPLPLSFISPSHSVTTCYS